MATQDAAQKTEQPTPQRRKKAREEGQLARARDAGGVAATAGVLLVLAVTGPSLGKSLHEFASWCFRHVGSVANVDVRVALQRSVETLGVLALPAAIAAALSAAAVGFGQAGFHPRLQLLVPKWERFNVPVRLKSMFLSPEAFTELMLSLARVGLVGYVAWATIHDTLPMLARLSRAGLLAATGGLWHAIGQLVLRSTLALVALAGADYVLSRLRLDRNLRMTRQEIKEEIKQHEGDPHMRARQRSRAREALRRALRKQVRSSDVVVTNPTHVAVALRYRRGQAAPVLTAKGYDEVAMHIRELARDAGVPIVENRELARDLARRVKVGRPIPADLYSAVAEVLAFVYRLRGQFWA